MKLGYLLSGGAPVIKKYKMAAGLAAGIIVLIPAANATGLSTSTTTSVADGVGLTMDAGQFAFGDTVAYSTVQGEIEHLQSVIINPDAVIEALLVGSATNAVLETRTVGTASSDGLTVVGTAGDTDPSNPDMDEGTVWYSVGGNGGASRKITSTTTTLTVTVIVPFAANRVGDRYHTVDYTPGTSGVTFSTNLQNVRGEIAATGATMRCVDLNLKGAGDTTIFLVNTDHAFGTN